MASTYSISGLASGLDWQTMITQLVELERKPIELLEERQTTLSNKKTAWSEFNTMLLTLKTAAGVLSEVDDFDLFTPSASVTGTSSDVEDLLSFAVGSNASEGSYSIKVNHLATAQKLASGSFSSTSAALGISGDITINDRVASIAATDTLADVQSKINALNSGDDPADVTASIISVSSTEYRLTLTSKTTGAAGMTVTDGTGSLGLTQLVAGQDAEIVIDDTYTITRSTNTIDDVISGVTLNLVGADTAATVTLNVGRDYAGIKENIQEFVDGYNKVMSYIAQQNTASEDGGTTGVLFADSSLQTIKSSLRNVILSQVSGLNSTLDHLSLIGVNLDKTGQLSINSEKLDGYLRSNFDDVVSLFAAQGASTSSSLTYIDSGTNTTEGDYEVEITQVATQAGTVGSVFSGPLAVDTTLTLTSSGGAVQEIVLSAGSNLASILEAINSNNTLGITAEEDAGRIRLTSSYGSAGSFTLSVSGGDLGLVNGTYTGLDVTGRIREEGASEWMTMTGKGQALTGDNDQDVEGLVVKYTGTGTGTFDFTFTKGVGEKLDQALYYMTDSVDGYVANKQTSLKNQVDSIDEKIEKMEIRLTKYQETLMAKYSAMETILNSLQSQQSWLTGQINSLSSGA